MHAIPATHARHSALLVGRFSGLRGIRLCLRARPLPRDHREADEGHDELVRGRACEGFSDGSAHGRLVPGRPVASLGFHTSGQSSQ
jgi:hypothetical protein